MDVPVKYVERMAEGQISTLRRPRMPAREREEMIVANAIRVVAADGFDISVRDLATRIGVPHSVLFRHFPSKDALSKRIYDEMFMSRFRPEWSVLLMDETLPLADRLLTFYRAYTAAIFDPTWVRIFLFAGLEGTSLNADYFEVLKAQVLEPICAAAGRHAGRVTCDATMSAAAMERAWGLHGRIFYLAIRQHVYRRPAPAAIDAVLNDAIIAFLDDVEHAETCLVSDDASLAPDLVQPAALRRRMSPEMRVRSIVDGAIPFFARRGVKGQMRELASHLGITHSLLFHYFPRKQDLIDKVYVEVFERPWHALGPLLREDGRPLGERLVAFYRSYLAIVDRGEWIRIFISAALHDAGLCGRYLDLVETEIIGVIAEAARKAIDAPGPSDLREDAWGLHGQLVYSAIRNHIYDMPTSASQQTTVETGVAVFLSALEIKRRELNSSGIGERASSLELSIFGETSPLRSEPPNVEDRAAMMRSER